MIAQERKDFLNDIAMVMQALVQESVAPLLKRLEELEKPVTPPVPARDGVDGRDGKDGVNGEKGLDGKDGQPGKDGINGSDGSPGIQGEKGLDGKDGIKGEKGIDGKDGRDGKDVSIDEVVTKVFEVLPNLIKNYFIEHPVLNGVDGKDGIVGKDGNNGIDGKDGSPGINGKDAEPVTIKQIQDAIDMEQVSKYVISKLDMPSYVKSVFENNPSLLPKDGKDGINGNDGSPGKDGQNGLDGKSFQDALIDKNDTLILTLSDGTTKNVGTVVGRDGTDGKDGKDGVNGKDGLTFDTFDESLEDGGRVRVLRYTSRSGETKEIRNKTAHMVYRGVFSEKEYELGDCVTYAGSLWHCNKATSARPKDDSDAWTLATKRGTDGRNAIELPRKPEEPVKV